MPKSKRNKLISLTKTKSKGRAQKETLIKNIREAVDTFSHIFIISVENMRNSSLKELRIKLAGSGRFFFGKNKVMALALGKTEAAAYRDNLHLLSKSLAEDGNRALFFTNQDKTWKTNENP